MGFSRFAATVFLAAAMASFAAERATAVNPTCVNLEAQLAALNRGSGLGSAASAREYDASVSRQRNEIQQATAEARRAGCIGGFLIFKPKPQPKCGALMATIERQKANLNRLIAARSRSGSDPLAVRQQRSELLRALSANRCGATTASFGQRRGAGGFFDALFGGGRVRTWGENGYFAGSPYGTYRTLCVRTCDGYYFPISFSTVPAKFASDAQSCHALCPGTDVGLYTHRNPGEESDSMVSLSGEPYTALPTAFQYRRSFDPNCVCGSPAVAADISDGYSDGYASDGPATLLTLGPLPRTSVPIPIGRRSASEDPETLSNRGGSFVPTPVAGVTVSAVIDVDPTGRRVRLVGPSYYYGRQTAAQRRLAPGKAVQGRSSGLGTQATVNQNCAESASLHGRGLPISALDAVGVAPDSKRKNG